MSDNIGLRFISLATKDSFDMKEDIIKDTAPESPGYYFILVRLSSDDDFTGSVIYCGQSTVSIKDRLLHHCKKLNDSASKWGKWYESNKHSITRLFYIVRPADFGIVYESFIIYRNLVGITFCLNRASNGHTNLIDLKDMNFDLSVPFAGCARLIEEECKKHVKAAAQIVLQAFGKKGFMAVHEDEASTITKENNMTLQKDNIPIFSTITEKNDMTLQKLDEDKKSEVPTFDTIQKIDDMTLGLPSRTQSEGAELS
jgi:hypothetical protein